MSDAPFVDPGQSSSGWHRLQCYIECPRLFGYKEVLGLVPKVMSAPLALGSAVHSGLGAHYLGMPFEKGLENPERGWAYKVPVAREICQAYVRHFIREPFKVLDVERELIVRINGRKFTRRIDLLFLQQDKVYAMDHKTAGRPQSRFSTTQHEAALFTQEVVGRATVQNIYGKPFGGVLLNVIGSSEPYEFIRRPLHFPPEVLRGAVASLDHWLKGADHLIQSGLSPWEYPQSYQCQGRYSKCDYWDLCKRGRSAETMYDYREAA
jgi:hypothetical protein